MPDRAIVLVQMGPVPRTRQRDACVAYVQERGWTLAAVVGQAGHARDAITMIARGEAEVVVVAFGGRSLAGDVVRAGGRVEAVHPRPHVVQPYVAIAPSLVAQLAERGKSPEQIAEILGETTGEIRRKLSE
jgi:hypothetical protein